MNRVFGSKTCRNRSTTHLFNRPVIVFIACVLFMIPVGCSKEHTLSRPEYQKEMECDRYADAALQNGDYSGSIELHQQFLEKNPGHGAALYHMGYAFAGLGDHDREIEYYEKAANSGFEKDDLFFNLGMAYGETQRYQDALRTFRKGLDAYPDNLDLCFGLATTLEAMGRYDQALDQLRNILDKDPDHRMAREMLNRIQKDRQNH